ncbi:hypothetical protein HNQ96_005152 [Aminobacter lissarensis]|uniref:Uncharacterized protein n=1 Tax=Aminobacter carboxidus TaxID=376165 RepID=A0A8E1WIU6_9HYPH|nr:hypothetical protein [Aminobacter lissarensis]MBB6469263.1 hypothetical protein [Aminobacter lissarensis]
MLFNLTRLNDFVNEFAAAIALLELVDQLEKMVVSDQTQDELTYTKNRHANCLWQEMAGRDAAMTVYQYRHTLEGIRKSMQYVPTMAASVNQGGLRNAWRALLGHFPNDLIRHAAGHRGEDIASPEKFKSHAVGGTAYRLPHMDGRTYRVTYKGAAHELVVDHPSLLKLKEVTTSAYAAFPALNGKLPSI